MSQAKTVIKVKSDSFDCYMTFEAYSEIRLQMSTGDFHTHTHEVIEIPIETQALTLECLGVEAWDGKRAWHRCENCCDPHNKKELA